MDRKNFLLKSVAGIFAFTMIKENTYAYAFSRADESAANCIPTTDDILGPYYRAGAPFRNNIMIPGEPGVKMTVKGKVQDKNCNPIAGALLDFWQADDAGAYDNTTSNYKHRGKMQTANDGSYSISTLHPGAYLNGNQYRPCHIHFRITAPGCTEIITQLYFQGDPYIAADTRASQPKAKKRIIPIINNTVIFNIDMDGTSTTTDIQDFAQHSPVKINENPFHNELRFFSPDEAIINVEIFNTTGQLIISQYNVTSYELLLDTGFLGNGIYYARIQTTKNIHVHKLVKN